MVLNILSLSPTTVNVQWKCTQAYNPILTWKVQVHNALEIWKRMDTKILDFCQNANNTGNKVNITISDLEEGMMYHLSLANKYGILSSASFNTLTTGKQKLFIHT